MNPLFPAETTPSRPEKGTGPLNAGVPSRFPGDTGANLPPDEATPTLRDWLARNAFLLLFILAAIIFAYWKLDLWSVTKVAIGLGLVIFIHELGHFAVAKWCDVYVETFSIGFGPALPGCSFRRGETLYKIALFPLGGYVKMKGEGTDAEEDEDDPRSFKNKSVGQRMAIISAGVIMNTILACICFVIVYLHGVEQPPAVVGQVDAGSPAFKKGLRAGDDLKQIDDEVNPYFTDMMFTVMTSRKGEPLTLVYDDYGPSGAPRKVETTIEPRRDKNDIKPVIGIAPASELKLIEKRYVKHRERPVTLHSPASRAKPGFEFGDTIIGTTDPAQPDQVTELRDDPRNPGSGRKDYFQYLDRMHRLSDKEVTVRVRRQAGEVVDLRVPPAAHWVLGARMAMGEIAAVRDGSPGAAAGFHLPSDVPGDVIREVKVLGIRNGALRLIHWNNADWDNLAKAGERSVEVTDKNGTTRLVRELDPLRLPHELERWARSRARAEDLVKLLDKDHNGKLSKQELHGVDWDFLKDARFDKDGNLAADEVARLVRRVVFVVRRTNSTDSQGHKGTETVPLHADWDDSWDYSRAVPFGPSSPLAVSGLGLAYRVKTVVEKVRPDSPADGKLQTGDVVKDMRLKPYKPDAKKDTSPGWWSNLFGKPSEWSSWSGMPETDDWWAHADYTLQQDLVELKELSLKVERGGETKEVELAAVPDASWPLDSRGLLLTNDLRLQKADGVGKAVLLGVKRTFRDVYRIYLSLYGVVSGQLSVKNFGGPIMIATTAYDIAGENFNMLILFLGIISINLAVINFLPIPVLDGGHMVFLVYEWVRGRPASEAVRALATYIGLFLIASLMILVIVLDLKRATQ